jgi:purine nucleosidase
VAPVPLILDVDTGIDDALAVLFAIASPEIDLIAVTAVTGNVSARQAALNSLAVLELAGVTDVEVARGASGPAGERPLAGGHGPRGLGGAELPAPTAAVSARRSAHLIAEEARARPGELLLVATGPLSNVAAALALEPELPSLLRGLTIGGGAYTTSVVETNMRIDPTAARAVFGSFTQAARLPVCVGLDVTERVRITSRDLDGLGAARGSDDLARFVNDAASFAIERYERGGDPDGAPLHDPLALAIAIDGRLAELRPARVAVAPDGMTAADLTADAARTNARVAIAVDAEVAKARILQRLGSVATRPARSR